MTVRSSHDVFERILKRSEHDQDLPVRDRQQFYRNLAAYEYHHRSSSISIEY
jgi:hypothetical protein